MMITYVAYFRPFKSTALNNLEVFNECSIILVIYCLFSFTDFVDDSSVKQTMGWVVIIIVLLNLLTNMATMIYLTVREACIRRKKKKMM